MSGCTCSVPEPPQAPDAGYRRALWIALVANAAMFGIEIAASFAAQSASLFADAVDFLGDAANYGVALFVLALAPVWRSRTALWKGWTMLAFGAFVLVKSVWYALTGAVPEALTMGVVSVLALVTNVGVAVLLYRYRTGDAQARSVWLCSRNDALGNLAVLAAAGGVGLSGTGWPDLAVALILAGLAIQAGHSVIRQARQELQRARP